MHSTQFNYHYLEFVGAAIINNCDDPGRGEGTPYNGLYEEEVLFRPKGIARDIFFQASGI